MADDKPIIIIKKKGGHGGHHGGAWKVAYADFVTAMMAFFMVMWLVNSAETTTKQSIASYFRRPGIFDSGSGTPLLIGESGILDASSPPVGEEKGKKSPAIHDSSQYQKKSGTDDTDQNKRVTYRGEDSDKPLPEVSEHSGINTDDPGDALSRVDKKKMLEEIAEDIRQQIQAMPELSELLGVVDIKVGADGLNIEIMDTEKASMFSSGSAAISPEAKQAFEKISGILSKMDNKIDILGHTDGKPFSSRKGGYSNWELSSDRANAARRLLEQSGIKSENITSVVGRADKDLRTPENPTAASNRRITLKMRFDFSKKVDLSKDPEALNKIPDYEKEHSEQIRIERERRAAEKEEKIHSMSAAEVNKDGKKVITIPEGSRKESYPPGKDKIFGDSPILGPPSIFYND